jgi:chromosome segregation ATPase
MYTYDDYLKFEAEGLSKEKIAKKMEISVATLYNRLKVWKQQPLKSKPKNVQVLQEQKEKTSEGENEQHNKSGELVALIATLKAEKAEHEEKVKELEKINQDREIAYEALKHSHNDLISQYSALKASISDNDLEKTRKVIDEYRIQAKDLQDKLQESEDNLEEVLGTNENLHKEIVVMNNSLARSTELLNGASDEIEKLTRKYENLKREVEPLRQLALMKLQQDAGA